MDLIRPFYYEDASRARLEQIQPVTQTPTVKETEIKNIDNMGVDFSFFTDSNKARISLEDATKPATKSSMKKTTRPKKNTKKLSDGSEIVLASDENESNDMDAMHSNVPYKNSYNETDNMLKTAIVQIDIMNNDIKNDIDMIRASKTLKNKFNYITDMTATSGTLLGTKITAIRELNNTIKTCHDLELKRIKELKLAEADNQDDDRRMMDMYSAFINTPIGNYSLGPGSIDLTASGGVVAGGDIGGIVRADTQYTNDAGYNNYISNMSPVQNAMRLENNPDVATVVKYNAETGQRWFDVVNKNTGESIPNVPRPDEFLLENLHINVSAGICRDTQLDRTYPLVVIGGNGSLSSY